MRRAAPLCRSAHPSLAVPNRAPYRRYSQRSNPFDEKDFKFRKADGKDRALVVMFGWLGAKEKYLKKYAEWYNDHRYPTVSYIPPLHSVYVLVHAASLISTRLFPTFSQKRGDDMAFALRDFSAQNPSTDIIFHTFSGNGLHFYGQVQKCLRQHSIALPNVRGIILDSPPYEITPEQFVSGFAGSVEVSDVLKPLNNALWRAFFKLYLSEQRIQRFKKMEHELIHHPPPIPQLVLYSDADQVTPVAGLPEYLSIQRARNLQVFAINFRTSAHVQHMRYFPDQYWGEVTKFIDFCKQQPKQT